MNEVEAEVWGAVEALNATWTSGRIEDLRGYLHEDMVAITPMDPGRLEGREACYASWARFASRCKILRFDAREPRVQVHGDTAVVTYFYEIAFEVAGVARLERGRDMFVMRRTSGRWLAVADQFSSEPATG